MALKHIAAFVALAVAAGAAAQQPAASPPPAAPPPPACETAEHRQFDFWVGSWNVYRTGTDTQVGRSLIEKLYSGCAIRENWMPSRGNSGGSLNAYLPHEKIWRQTWVDSSNGHVEFKGGFRDGAMVLTGFWRGVNGPGQDGLVRMTYTKDETGAVRQLGELSTDDGKSWSPAFDLTYRKAAAN